MRIGEYPRSMRENMDETPAFYDMIPAKSTSKTGSKEYIVSTSSCQRKHVIIVLWAIVDGKLLPPMIFYYLQKSNTCSREIPHQNAIEGEDG